MLRRVFSATPAISATTTAAACITTAARFVPTSASSSLGNVTHRGYFPPRKPRTRYWCLAEEDPAMEQNAANALITRSLQDVQMPKEVSQILHISHPQSVQAMLATPFIPGDETSMTEMSHYYRRVLRNAVPADKLLKQIDENDGSCSGSDAQHTHLNSNSTLLAFCVANTSNGPIIQRFLLFRYRSSFNDLTSVESQFARRQIAAVWVTSLMGCGTFVTKTNAMEHNGRTVVTRRFVEGVDYPKFLELEGEEAMRDLLAQCADNNGLLKIALIKTAANALDLHNPHNVIVPNDTDLKGLARVISIDHEMEFPSPTMVRWFRERNHFFESNFPMTEAEIDIGSNSPALPGSFAWRHKQAVHEGQREFARRQLEVGKESGYLEGHVWGNLLLLKNRGDVEKTLDEGIPPELLSRVVDGYRSAVRVLDLLGISRESRESFRQYMKHAQRFVATKKPMKLMDMLAPMAVEGGGEAKK